MGRELCEVIKFYLPFFKWENMWCSSDDRSHASFTKSAKQEVYNPPCDTISITSDGSLKASDDPLHVHELSNYAIANSPYESCLTDWASGWLEEQSEVRHYGDCPSLDLCFCYPVWNSEDCSHTSIWSNSGPLWDVDWLCCHSWVLRIEYRGSSNR